jgi:hypothetical protein
VSELQPANYCRRCGQDFGSLSAFDTHQVGNVQYDWSPEREDGFRCLDVNELQELGWHQDTRERWRRPISESALLRIRQLRGAPETSRVESALPLDGEAA